MHTLHRGCVRKLWYTESDNNVIVWDAPAHILFCPEAWYTLHIDALREERKMDHSAQDALLFFEQHPAVYPLYKAFQEKLLLRYPETRIKVQRSQISFYNRHLYACVSFLRVKRKAELPENYFVLTLGLPAPLESERVAAKTEPYPGRWTTHFILHCTAELDEELFDWVGQAYQFAQIK